MKPILFQEEQKFRPVWMIVILILIEVILVGDLTISILNGKAFGPVELIFNLLMTLFPAVILLVIYAFNVRLVSTISEEGVSFAWLPFPKKAKTISWQEIKSIQFTTYSFVGYGWRFSSKYGTVNNVSGNKGIALELNNGSKFLIGTQKSADLINTAIEPFNRR